MSKNFLTFGITFIVILGIFIPSIIHGAECTPEQRALGYTPRTISAGIGGAAVVCDPPGTNSTTDGAGDALGFIFSPFAKGVSMILLALSSWILALSGWLFDYIVEETIINMAKNLDSGIGSGITTAWKTMRDLSNIVFIFVLLYAAFKTIFDANIGNFGRTIINIIIVALLINFSLFITKVVIDASNVVSTGFYNSIAKANTQTSLQRNGETSTFDGISGGYMKLLGLQTWYGSGSINDGVSTGKIFILGVMGSIFMLMTAVILFVSGMMFVARFIILIFLMILSPLACIAYTIPGQNDKFSEFIEALKNQAFFAPVFFMFTWITFKVGSGIVTIIPPGSQWGDMVNTPKSGLALVFNYIILMGLAVTALTMSKDMATSGRVGGYFKKVSAGATTLGAGGVAVLGRQTIGRAASRLAESKGFQDLAAKSVTAQKFLEGTRGVAKSSFDVRGVAGTKFGKMINADQMMSSDVVGTVSEKAKGGFDARLQRQIKSKEAFAQTLTTDQQKQNYAARQMGGIKSLVTRGGSKNSTMSLFGSIGRSNRIVASKILNNQTQTLQTTLSGLQSSNTQLNSQLLAAQNELNTYNNITANGGNLGQRQQARYNILNGGPQVAGSIQYIQNQITSNQNQIGLIQPQVQNLQGQIDNFGLTNPKNTAPLSISQQVANANHQANLTPQQRLANLQAQLNGQPLPHPPPHQARPLRADEQNY